MSKMNRENATILVVDDTEANIDMMLAILKGYDVLPATSGQDALDILKEESVDLILLDIMMVGIDGYEVCRQIKKDSRLQNIPVIFITSKTDEKSIIQAYEVGGIDYVAKPFRPVELLARVKIQLKLQETIKRLEFLASHDSLTGIFNRRKFFELALRDFEEAGSDFYGIMIDIDHFKRFNDTYGHATGDIVLKNVTNAIEKVLPPNAIFGRMGGEEFAATFRAHSNDSALTILRSVQRAVSDLRIDIKTKKNQGCTVSSGLAVKSDNYDSLDALLQEADRALYEAKKSGRDRAIFRQG